MADGTDFPLHEDTPIHSLGQYQAWGLRVGGAIDMMWISRAHAERPAAHRLLPHGEPSIAIRRKRDANGDLCAVDLTICGPFRRTAWYRPEPREELIAIRMKPECAAGVFGVFPEDYVNAPPASPPKALRDACAGALRIAEYGEINEIAAALTANLLTLAHQRTIQDGPEIAAAAMLRRTSGRLSCGKIAERLELSERHLRRRFRDRLGCSPKTYARHLRLTFATLAAEREEKPDWAQLAINAGFHDQAHMINDFRSTLGLTPLELHGERRALII